VTCRGYGCDTAAANIQEFSLFPICYFNSTTQAFENCIREPGEGQSSVLIRWRQNDYATSAEVGPEGEDAGMGARGAEEQEAQSSQ